MARGKPKKNTTPYKEGDVVMFLRDIKKDDWRVGSKVIIIPKNVPVTIKQINNSHVWVLYKGETHWLRCIVERMIPATEAAIVLFGEKDVNSKHS
jgi:hypothetical protein